MVQLTCFEADFANVLQIAVSRLGNVSFGRLDYTTTRRMVVIS